jgi:hypothetical protein
MPQPIPTESHVSFQTEKLPEFGTAGSISTTIASPIVKEMTEPIDDEFMCSDPSKGAADNAFGPVHPAVATDGFW